MRRLGCPVWQVDLSCESSIIQFASQFTDTPIAILLNIAGVMMPKPQDTLGSITQSVLEKTFAVNTYGPLLLTQALLPSLLLAEDPKVGFMSSRVGSIADNSSGGIYAYRASKAALNSIGKSLAMDLKGKGVTVTLMHPGYVKTGIDKDNHSRDDAVEPREAARKLWEVFKEKGVDQTGRFWHREGFELPW